MIDRCPRCKSLIYHLGNCHCIETQSRIEVVEAEESPQTSIEELWAMMPEDNKQYYRNCIEVYRHHKLAQALKERD